MRTKGTYYLGRVIKMGLLDEDKIFDALQNPATMTWHNNT